jgi:hypothetical protein
MRRTSIATLILVALASVLTLSVSADNPHYKRGPNVVDNGFTATATGSVTGLGNGDVIVTLSFPNATGTTVCKAPGKNGTEAPGQNPAVPAASSGSQFIDDPKNGNLTFTVTTDPPADPTAAAAGCPNSNWGARFDNITFGCGTLTIRQETFQGSGDYEVVLETQVCLP